MKPEKEIKAKTILICGDTECEEVLKQMIKDAKLLLNEQDDKVH